MRRGQGEAERGLRRAGWLASLTAMVFLGACVSFDRIHGYAPSQEQLNALRVGVDTRETVAEAVGTPTSSGVLRDSGYFYVTQQTRTVGARPTEIISRQIVAISFDQRGVVKNIETFDLRDGKAVALSRRVTDSSVQDLSFFRQLVGSITNFDPSQFFGGGE